MFCLSFMSTGDARDRRYPKVWCLEFHCVHCLRSTLPGIITQVENRRMVTQGSILSDASPSESTCLLRIGLPPHWKFMKVPSCAHRMGKSPQKSLEGLVLKGWTKKQKPSPWIIWMASLAQSLRGAWSAKRSKRYCQDLTKVLKSVWNHQLINVDHGTKEWGIGQIKI